MAALAIEREIGSQRDEAITLCNFADLLGGQGQTERARETFAASLALPRELGDRDTEAVTLQQLGEFELGQGRIDEGLSTLRTALELTRVIGNRRVQGQVLRELDDRPLLADLLCTRGLVDLARADRTAAQAALSEAEQVANAINAGPTSNLNRRIERLRTAITSRDANPASSRSRSIAGSPAEDA